MSNPFLRPGEHWNPYTRLWEPNLTEADVQKLWPYAKNVPMEPIEDWMEETLTIAGLDPKPSRKPPLFDTPHPEEDTFEVPQMVGSELTSAPDRKAYSVTKESIPYKDWTQLEPPLTGEQQEVLGAEVANMLAMADNLKDNVVLPEHYARFKIEPIRFVCDNSLNFFQGNVIKYIMRWDAKNGLEDLKKAQRYLSMFILWVEGNEDWWK